MNCHYDGAYSLCYHTSYWNEVGSLLAYVEVTESFFQEHTVVFLRLEFRKELQLLGIRDAHYDAAFRNGNNVQCLSGVVQILLVSCIYVSVGILKIATTVIIFVTSSR